MALTLYQHEVCRLIAAVRRAQGASVWPALSGSYVAGGVALNALTNSPRVSRDIDLFHDEARAVQASWTVDRARLESSGHRVAVVRERETFVEALVSRGPDRVLLQWTLDSAYRFFPLLEHEDFGLVLHPFDLATNKVLALVGRLEARDWVDVISCCEKIQPLGYLAWAASGKDPGFSPMAILEQAARSARYTEAEIAALEFSGTPPRAEDLSRRWHDMLAEARAVVACLPPAQVGRCVLDAAGNVPMKLPASELAACLARDGARYHPGSLHGALPRLCNADPDVSHG